MIKVLPFWASWLTPLLPLREDAPKDGWEVTVVWPASLWRTSVASAREQWRGIRPVRRWVMEGKLPSGLESRSPWQPGLPPSMEPDPPAGKLWGLPEALPLGLAFL